MRTATRESLGTISFRSSSCLPLISGERVDSPVMFPPSRARLATKPEPTGSLSHAMTIGLVPVAPLAGRVAVGPLDRMTSTLRRTSSAARSGSRSNFPSAHRYSMTMLFPSTYPSSRRPCRNASVRGEIEEGETALRNPIRETFFGCCASAAELNAKSMVPSAMRKNVFLISFSDLILRSTFCALYPAAVTESLSAHTNKFRAMFRPISLAATEGYTVCYRIQRLDYTQGRARSVFDYWYSRKSTTLFLSSNVIRNFSKTSILPSSRGTSSVMDHTTLAEILLRPKMKVRRLTRYGTLRPAIPLILLTRSLEVCSSRNAFPKR